MDPPTITASLGMSPFCELRAGLVEHLDDASNPNRTTGFLNVRVGDIRQVYEGWPNSSPWAGM